MRRSHTLLLLLLLSTPLCGQTITNTEWREDIKSVQLYKEGAELEFPILYLNKPERLHLEFDILKPEAEQLYWTIRHCDRLWNLDSLSPTEFMTGLAEGMVDEYDYSFNTRMDYVHYKAVLPDAFSVFIHSGNYVISVLDDSRNTLVTRRFQVTEQSLKTKAKVTFPYDGIDRERKQEVDVWVEAKNVNNAWINIYVQQNGRLDLRQELQHSGYEREWMSYSNRLNNIFWAGNTFRYFDCSNMYATMYNVMKVEEYGGLMYVILRPEENRSRKQFIQDASLNGGWKTNVWDRNNPKQEADYVWVVFSLPMEQPLLDGSIHIVGEITNWHIDDVSRMEYNKEKRAYIKMMLLKQGYYSYQLLVDRKQSKTAGLEGDHWESHNKYKVEVYQHAPNDIADRLLHTSTIQP